VAEVAGELGVTPEEVVQAMDGVRPPTSIHQTVHEGDGDPIYLLDQLVAEDGQKEGVWIDRVALRESLEHLDDRERMVILLRFFRDKTQTEVAAILGCSQVQVSRLERRALERIREQVNTG
jgi:RNA polymerase sporulation-specific sigma factor